MLKHKILSIFGQLKYRNKIMLAFLLVSMIPVAILGTFCYLQTRSLLMDEAKSNLQFSLNQASQEIDSQLSTYENTLNYLSFNPDLLNAAFQEYTSNFDMYIQLFDVIDQTFSMTRSLHPDMEQITLYTGTNLYPHGNTVYLIDTINHTWWYQKVMDSVDVQWFTSGSHLFMARQMINTKLRQHIPNVLYAEINKNTVFAAAKALITDGADSVIATREGQIIMPTDRYDLSMADIIMKKNETFTHDGVRYALLSAEIPATDWVIYLYKPLKLIAGSANDIALTVLLILLVCIAALIVISNLFSTRIVTRIECLRQNMKAVEAGNFEVTVESHSNDEIDDLIHSFHAMINRIQHLIHKVYLVDIEKKEYEMKALQAQINPHFLYNSLSLINWRAIRLNAPDISEMAQLLSTFYRTTLNRGNSLTTVSDEILNVRSYTKIQLIMHSDRFSVDYQISEDTLPYSIPNLMLQPLLENAILHGIDQKEEGIGKITVSAYKETTEDQGIPDTLVFLVQDNGVGIAKEKLDTLFETDSKGYGIHNINNRSKLLYGGYGDHYGLSAESIPEAVTTFILRIPALMGDNDNIFHS